MDAMRVQIITMEINNQCIKYFIDKSIVIIRVVTRYHNTNNKIRIIEKNLG